MINCAFPATGPEIVPVPFTSISSLSVSTVSDASEKLFPLSMINDPVECRSPVNVVVPLPLGCSIRPAVTDVPFTSCAEKLKLFIEKSEPTA